ncbi:hypothetical protein [Mesorhizobium amorphae]|uniref:hypothetical protein n=1 Tax=Mesorhizobium amorphae TaxID=71433 RepID=UPI00177EA2F4|nr:hypothetical protein [Mesorhizobium amorphae]
MSLLSQFADRLEIKHFHDKLYTELHKIYGESIPFEIAVFMSVDRLGRIPEYEKRHFHVIVGIVEAERFKPKHLGPGEWDKASIEKMIELSERSYDIFQAVRFIAQIKTNLVSSPRLSAWHSRLVAGLLFEPPKNSGQSRYKNLVRDTFMVGEIKRLAQVGFKPTRNKATEPAESACDAIAVAWGRLGNSITYDGVANVWNCRDQIPEIRSWDALFA